MTPQDGRTILDSESAPFERCKINMYTIRILTRYVSAILAKKAAELL
jgi:hypothetical protein